MQMTTLPLREHVLQHLELQHRELEGENMYADMLADKYRVVPSGRTDSRS
jgi:hypothetical protein